MELICSLVCEAKKGKKVTDFYYYITSRIHGRIIKKKESGILLEDKRLDHAERE